MWSRPCRRSNLARTNSTQKWTRSLLGALVELVVGATLVAVVVDSGSLVVSAPDDELFEPRLDTVAVLVAPTVDWVWPVVGALLELEDADVAVTCDVVESVDDI